MVLETDRDVGAIQRRREPVTAVPKRVDGRAVSTEQVDPQADSNDLDPRDSASVDRGLIGRSGDAEDLQSFVGEHLRCQRQLRRNILRLNLKPGPDRQLNAINSQLAHKRRELRQGPVHQYERESAISAGVQ